jgi:hypothetical protein
MAGTGSAKRKVEEGNLGRLVMDDLRTTKLPRAYSQEIRDLYQFYLDDERRTRLAGMGRLRRAFSLLGWLFKSLLLKLSPPRRLLLLIALIFTILGPSSIGVPDAFRIGVDLRPWAIVILLIVLMLELKDKLLARDEIEIARQVQLALLPEQHPTPPGWRVWSYSRPANDVGGDLVDYIELDGFRQGVLLGDVAGKGLGAALLTAKLQATLRALMPHVASLDELGERLNTILYRDGLDNRFATLFYAELEHHSGQVRYLNAGHNPAFVVGPDRMVQLTASSLPLGMMDTTNYQECSIDLEPGEVLLAYSDGLTEAMNLEGEEFGATRLEARLREMPSLDPEQIGRRLLEKVDEFLGEARVTDDLSLIVVTRI